MHQLLTLLFVSILIANFNFLNGQGKIYLDLQQKLDQYQPENVHIFNKELKGAELAGSGVTITANARYFTIDPAVCNNMILRKPKVIKMTLPYGNEGKFLNLLLFEKNIRAANAKVKTSDGKQFKPSDAAFYRGIIEGDETSIASITFSNNTMNGVISSDLIGQFDMGKIFNKDIYTIYEADKLPYKPSFVCSTDDNSNVGSESDNSLQTRDAGDCVRIWVEADFALYQNKGGTQQTQDYIDGFFNSVATFYDNDGINVTIGYYYIWTSMDPYPRNNSNNALTTFRNTRNNLNGQADIAHLVALGGNNLGGIAYLNVLCNNNIFHAYSNIDATYQDFPNYSWTVMVFCHEMGHNLGSEHTHWCGWNGGAIDNCYTPEGSCQPGPPPTGGGTIMSYCHLTNYGINFTKGFGPQPGNKVRSKVENASCLAPCSNQCPDYAIQGQVTDILCNGSSTGKIDVTEPSAGTAPYTYNWSNGMTGQHISNLPAGTYVVTVTDAVNCTETAEFTVTQPPAMEYTNSKEDVSCYNGNDGWASILVSGGLPPYSYSWSNGQHTQQINNLIAGNYTVTVADANNCTITQNIQITQPTRITVSDDIKNVSCNNYADGYIHTSAIGGTGYLLFQWSTGSNNTNIDNLTAGIYFLTITDGNGCSVVENFEVTQPDVLGLTVMTTDVTMHGGNDGTAEAVVTGGTLPYQYIWSNGKTTKLITGLAAGNYIVTVTDNNGCTTYQSFVINEPGCTLEGSVTKQDISCHGMNNGLATAAAQNNSGTVSYQWSNGETTQTITNLAAGTYSVTMTDGNCSIIKTVSVTEPSTLFATADGQPTSCNGNTGSATANGTGGSPGYLYAWSNGSSTKTIVDLSAGLYTVTITDSKGCTSTATVNISVVDNQLPVPDPLYAPITIYLGADGQFDLNTLDPDLFFKDNCGMSDVTFNARFVTCNNVGAEFSSIGTGIDLAGNQASGTFIFIVKDTIVPAINCPADINQGVCQGIVFWPNIVPTDNCGVQTMHQIEGLPSGSLYPIGTTKNTLEVIDNSGNKTTCSFYVTISEGLVIGLDKRDVSCNGLHDGSAKVNTENIDPPYTINWSTGDTTVAITGLNQGHYSVTVVDGTGCSDVQVFDINEPARISVDIVSITHATGSQNADGAIDISVAGGVPPYVFEWRKNGELIATSEDLTGILPGTYEILVRDKNGCTIVGAEIIVQVKGVKVNNDLANSFVIYPNPADGRIFVNSTEQMIASARLDLYDIFGRKILDQSFSEKATEKYLDVTGLIPGSYFLRITSGDKSFISKVIIQH